MKIFRSSDPWGTVIIVLTFGLFILSVFLKGFTHELILEGAVFLVSVKLILLAEKAAKTEERMERHLMEIKGLLEQRDSRNAT